MERVQRLLWHLVAPLDEAQDACGVEEGTAPVVSIGEGVVEKEEEEQVAGILRSVRSFVGELVSDLVPGEDEVRMRREHRALRERMQKNQQQQQQWEEGDQGMMRWLNDSTAVFLSHPPPFSFPLSLSLLLLPS